MKKAKMIGNKEGRYKAAIARCKVTKPDLKSYYNKLYMLKL